MFSRLIIDYLDDYVLQIPDKIIFADESRELTYAQFAKEAKAVAAFLASKRIKRKPIALYMDNTPECLAAFVGVMLSGNFYCPIDTGFAYEGIRDVYEQLHPELTMVDARNLSNASIISEFSDYYFYDELINTQIDEVLLKKAREEIVETDIAYILFTSGSTGKPKGVAISHRALMAYIEWVVKAMNFTEDTVFGSQHPFLFSASVTDIYGTLVSGAQMWIIPRRLYKTPVELIKWMDDKEINTIYMVPSALEMIARGDTFERIKPKRLTKCMFVGEPMPPNVLEKWINACNPDTVFVNLFGPTETVDICTFYIIPDEWENDGTPVPIGISCENCDSFIVNDKMQLAGIGEVGELYVRGPFLAYGYYNNPQKTSEAFVQNPLQDSYPEVVYRTGDLATIDERGIIHCHGRKDNQIKIMGYRIELGQIESAVSSLAEIDRVKCVFEEERKLILCFYKGDVEKDYIRKSIKDKLPRYMMPHKYYKVDEMPLNVNGKIDKSELVELYRGKYDSN